MEWYNVFLFEYYALSVMEPVHFDAENENLVFLEYSIHLDWISEKKDYIILSFLLFHPLG